MILFFRRLIRPFYVRHEIKRLIANNEKHADRLKSKGYSIGYAEEMNVAAFFVYKNLLSWLEGK